MKRIISQSKVLLYFLALSFTLIACKTEEDAKINEASVSFNIADVVFASDNVIEKKASISNSKPEVQIEKYDNFSMELSAESAPNYNTIGLNSTTSSNSISSKANASKIAATNPMVNGTKYMLLIYRVNGNTETFFSSHEVTVSNTDFRVVLSPNQSYKWYAYSYNQTASLPLPANLNSPVIPSKTDAPLLFASGPLTLNNVNQRVNMTFHHKIAKIEMVVNGQYLFANSFQVLNLDFNNLTLTSHNYDIKTGNKIGNAINTQNITNQPIVFQSTYQGSIEVKGIQQSTNTLYTSTDNPTINIAIKGITINKTGNIQVLHATSAAPRNASFNGFTSAGNYVKRVLLKLLYEGGTVYPYEWAQGNLYYDETDPTNPYKFADPVNRSETAPCNYYWNWNTLLPRNKTGASLSPVGDPCSKVLPLGEWKTPSRQDFIQLSTYPAIPNQANGHGGAIYYEAEDGERVYFHEAGEVKGNCNPTNDNDGHYWSSTNYNNSRAWYLEIDERGGTGAGNRIETEIKTQGRSVRCVRDN